ncbi:glutaredoxin-like protein NrdH [Oenococcus oeni]|uniref:glutaredoxin-like protein NrdH n=1 Tax=Oenococcus oeni TaxID=1247 RepID=UPI000277B61E|nr:glutaredoxin-like protein NrdH [Oenococcus oeni]EJO03848.1 ribonucleoside-diphosphate reductase class Ib glutaredoxin subunit [Oenococcus oeni AWRIB548]EJO04207.1 ribonucleoside-diphosphate reductase class Ib glutaredoxin subunit [Oenococcus oeni AWRIB422]KEP86632.1 glutaredoxin [Oenococcus oeni IOEB_0205]KGH67733.1 glutaredoxin [Oenococcus oeni IOEB_B16]OIL00409.1 NrdH-redoxin [Oenococcus oeni]
MADITVYTKNNCVQCKMTKNFLTSMNIDFKEINIDEHPELIAQLKAEGHRQTPVVKISGFDSFSGFRPDALKKVVAAKAAA